MSNLLMSILGLVLIGFGFFFFINAMPSVVEATDTGAGSVYENRSSTFKNTMSFVNSGVVLFPAIFFLAGFALVLKGVL